MRRLSNIIDALSKYVSYACGILVVLMIVLIQVEVFTRYVIGKPLMVSDEFSAYMLVAVCFLGAAYTLKEKGHVRITFLVSRLPPRIASWLRLVSLIFVLVFASALTQASYGFLGLSLKLGLTSSTWLRIPLQGPHMTVAIGFTLLSLLLVFEIAKTAINIRAGVNIEERGE